MYKSYPENSLSLYYNPFPEEPSLSESGQTKSCSLLQSSEDKSGMSKQTSVQERNNKSNSNNKQEVDAKTKTEEIKKVINIVSESKSQLQVKEGDLNSDGGQQKVESKSKGKNRSDVADMEAKCLSQQLQEKEDMLRNMQEQRSEMEQRMRELEVDMVLHKSLRLKKKEERDSLREQTQKAISDLKKEQETDWFAIICESQLNPRSDTRLIARAFLLESQGLYSCSKFTDLFSATTLRRSFKVNKCGSLAFTTVH
ncbi:centromere-associated protein E-like [Silurus meridionalis]|uniref:centromere-associated protein E-like n=1 Tax=Silurus meridionalis TaxID=175797 RepID=UPI001EEC75C9|nr:centromere-associated protein E-like [Silurus meridionalis]